MHKIHRPERRCESLRHFPDLLADKRVILKPCPHCRRKVNGGCRRNGEKTATAHFTATVSLFCDATVALSATVWTVDRALVYSTPSAPRFWCSTLKFLPPPLTIDNFIHHLIGRKRKKQSRSHQELRGRSAHRSSSGVRSHHTPPELCLRSHCQAS